MGSTTENRIASLLSAHLFEEFVFPNPRVRKKGRELADVLVALDDTLLIVQEKTPEPGARGERDPLGWARKNVLSAYRQIARTWTYIESGQALPLTNRRVPERILDASALHTVIGIAVVGVNDVGLEPVIALEKAKKRFPVLTLALSQLTEVLRAFDTIGDFVSAVMEMARIAEELSRTASKPKTIQCLAALTTYLNPTLTEAERLTMCADAETASSVWKEFVGEGGWLGDRAEILAGSYFIDEIVSRLHECEEQYDAVKRRPQHGTRLPDRSQWRKIAEYLVRLPRQVRNIYGTWMVSMLREAEAARQHRFGLVWLDQERYLCVFLAQEGSDEERERYLTALVQITWSVKRCSSVLGIATKSDISGTRSFQIVMMSGEHPPEIPAGAQQLADLISSLRIRSVDLRRGPR